MSRLVICGVDDSAGAAAFALDADEAAVDARP
jgi:hypothetical protein